MQIVEKCPDGTQVERTQTFPIFAQDHREDWKYRRFCFSTRSWGDHQNMVSIQDGRNHLFLEWPQLAPTEAVDDVMLESRMKKIKR